MEGFIITLMIICSLFSGCHNNTENEDILPEIDETVSLHLPLDASSIITKEIYEEKAFLEYKTVYKNDGTLEIGEKKTYQNGKRGEKIDTYEITFEGGIEISREIISSKEILPTDEIILIGTKPKTKATGVFNYPLKSVYVTSKYGWRNLNGESDYHIGIDLRASIGTKVFASDGGIVIQLKNPHWSYGNLIVIDHENGYRTYYAHLSEIAVKAGDRVYKGQFIGKSGDSGNTFGAHLHFEIRQRASDGVYYTLDPLKKLKTEG